MEKKLLKEVIGVLLDIEVGIYPKKVVGKNGYEKRTEYMEGWNAGVLATIKEICESLDDLGVEVTEDKYCNTEVEFL